MRQLLIQMQPARVVGFDESAHRAQLEAFGRESTLVEQMSVSSGVDDGRYLNLTFDATDVDQLWGDLREALFRRDGVNTQLADVSIVTCHGQNGWDDYLLLHHFDAQVEVE